MRSGWLRYVGIAAIGGGLGVVPVVGAVGATDGTDAGSTPDTSLPAPVEAASSMFTLPLFGAPLTIEVSTDPAGALASVAINPADGYTAIADRPNRVVFVNEDGTGAVRVDAGRRGDQVKVRGTALGDILGAGGWSGDVFGDGVTTTVGFTIADRGDGTPDIVDVTSSDATATIGATEYHSSGWGSSAKAIVVFANGAQKRALSIAASVRTHGDETGASVSATLSNLRGVPQAAADAAGVHTWDGLLCDGTAAHIEYTVGTDGTVSGVSATPDGAAVGEQHRGSTTVTFTSGERVKIKVREHDGEITINVVPAFRCDTADPAVNTPVETMPPGGWDHDGYPGHDRGDDHGWDPGDQGPGGGWHDGDGRGDGGWHDGDGRGDGGWHDGDGAGGGGGWHDGPGAGDGGGGGWHDGGDRRGDGSAPEG